MISLKKLHADSIPICTIRQVDNKQKPKTIWYIRPKYLNENGDLEESLKTPFEKDDLLHTNHIKLLKKAKKIGLQELEIYKIRQYLLKKNEHDFIDELGGVDMHKEHIKSRAKNIVSFIKENKNEICIHPNQHKIFLNPVNRFNKPERLVHYIAAQSGAGKSYQCSFIVDHLYRYYKDEGKKKKIVIFSLKGEGDDPAYEKLKNAIYIDINQICENPMEDIKTQLFRDSIVIFDDIDILPKKQKLVITHIQSLLLELGRSFNIDVLLLLHITTAGFKSKQIFNEMKSILIFPETMGYSNLNYLCVKKLGLPQDLLVKIKRLEYCQIVPIFKLIITPKSCFLY